MQIISFLSSSNQSTNEVASNDLYVRFLNFRKAYENISDLAPMQTFNLINISDNELDGHVSEIHEMRQYRLITLIRYYKKLMEITPHHAKVANHHHLYCRNFSGSDFARFSL